MNTRTLFESEEIYSIPAYNELEFHYKNKRISGPVVVVKKDDLSETNLRLMQKIMSAVGYELENACEIIVVSPDHKYDFKKVPALSEIKSTIFFGNLSIHFDLQFIVHLNDWLRLDDCHLLFTHDLATLTRDQSAKQSLWNVLKARFK